MNKVTCPICGKEITTNNINKHINSHNNNPNYFKESYSLSHDGLNCIYCGKECKSRNSLCQHEIRCKLNPNKIHVVSNAKSLIGKPA